MPHSERLLKNGRDCDHEVVVPLKRRGIRQAAGIAVRAFREDPMMEYIFPRGSDDEAKARRFSVASIHYGRSIGRVDTTMALHGVAVWVPPGHNDVSMTAFFMSGMLFVPLLIGRISFRRLLDCIEYTVQVHHELMTMPHWYLQELAVDPLHQGRGIGAALIQPVLDEADRTGHPCYLETFTGRGVRFYKRRGFHVVREGSPPRGGPHCYSMVREPH